VYPGGSIAFGGGEDIGTYTATIQTDTTLQTISGAADLSGLLGPRSQDSLTAALTLQRPRQGRRYHRQKEVPRLSAALLIRAGAVTPGLTHVLPMTGGSDYRRLSPPQRAERWPRRPRSALQCRLPRPSQTRLTALRQPANCQIRRGGMTALSHPNEEER
jgi:hypothetical protein